MNELYFSVKDITERLNISLKSAYKLTKEPGFPVCRAGGKILIPADQLQAWLDQGGSARTAPERRMA